MMPPAAGEHGFDVLGLSAEEGREEHDDGDDQQEYDR